MNPVHRLLDFAKDVATNYDCECGRAGSCRACAAKAVIRDVLGDVLAESLLKGPYYGNSEGTKKWLADNGCPTAHLTANLPAGAHSPD